MKTTTLIAGTLLLAGFACTSALHPGTPPVSFGIYETVRDTAVSDTGSQRHMQVPEGYRLFRTHDPVDPGKKIYAVFNCPALPSIDNADIRSTHASGNRIEIGFNMEGARKWAAMTRKNTGRTVVFVLNNQVYAMPLVQGEIRNGAALINNLESEEMAKKLSDGLNATRD